MNSNSNNHTTSKVIYRMVEFGKSFRLNVLFSIYISYKIYFCGLGLKRIKVYSCSDRECQ